MVSGDLHVVCAPGLVTWLGAALLRNATSSGRKNAYFLYRPLVPSCCVNLLRRNCEGHREKSLSETQHTQAAIAKALSIPRSRVTEDVRKFLKGVALLRGKRQEVPSRDLHYYLSEDDRRTRKDAEYLWF